MEKEKTIVIDGNEFVFSDGETADHPGFVPVFGNMGHAPEMPIAHRGAGDPPAAHAGRGGVVGAGGVRHHVHEGEGGERSAGAGQ